MKSAFDLKLGMSGDELAELAKSKRGEKVSEYKVIALSCEILDFKQNATPAQSAQKAL